MTNNPIFVKRTSVADREANTETLPNAGELALNILDGRMFSTNGEVVFEIGANTKNCRVSNFLYVGNDSINVTANSTQINAETIQLGTAVYVGANVDLAPDYLFIGNDSINAVMNSSVYTLNGVNILANVQSSNVALSRISSATYYTLQDMQDVVHSAGWTSGGGVSDLANGSVSVAAGTGLIRDDTSGVANLFFVDWGVTTISPDDETETWIYLDYNGGSPVISSGATEPNYFTQFPVAVVFRSGTDMHINESVRHAIGDHASLMAQAMRDTMPYARVSGAVLSETGTRNIAITAGEFWHGLVNFTSPPSNFDSSGAGTFDVYYRDGVGGWTEVASQTQVNNAYWDDGTGTPNALTAQHYGNYYVYLGVDGDVRIQFGQGDYVLLANAEAAPVPSPPPELLTDSFLIGKIIVQAGASTFTEVLSVYSSTFSTSPVTDHNSLAGLQGGTSSEYYHLTSAEYSELQTFETLTTSNSTTLSIGSTTNAEINATSVALQNSTVSWIISKPTAAEVSSGDYYLGSNGTWQQPPAEAVPGGSDTYVQFNNSDTFGGSAGFTFNTTTNVVSIANSLSCVTYNGSGSNKLVLGTDPLLFQGASGRPLDLQSSAYGSVNIVGGQGDAWLGFATSTSTTSPDTWIKRTTTGSLQLHENLLVDTLFEVGNSTINTVANSTIIRLANSTVTFDISKPTASEASSGDYYLGSNGTWQQPSGGTAAGANTQIQFNDSTAFGASDGFTFDKDTNNAVIANTLTIGVSVINTTSLAIGANVVLSTGTLLIGNSTVNSVSNSINIRLANSTVTFDISKPTAAEVSSGDYYLASDSTWKQPAAGDAATRVYESFVATGGQTDFVLSSTFANSLVDVFYNGVHLRGTEYTPDSDANTVTLGEGANTGAIVEVVAYANASLVLLDVGGSDSYVQYNNGGNIGGTAGFTFDDTANNVLIANTLTVGSATINSTNYSQTANNSTNFNGHAESYYANVTNPSFSTSIAVGSNVSVTTTAVSVGNSTANLLANSIIVTLANTSGTANLQPTQLVIGSTVVSNRIVESVVTLSDGATVSLDASLGNIFDLTAAGNRTIAIPSNATDGQKIIIRHRASGADRTLTVNTNSGGFRFGTDITALDATTSGTTDYIGAIYDNTDGYWDIVAFTKGY